LRTRRRRYLAFYLENKTLVEGINIVRPSIIASYHRRQKSIKDLKIYKRKIKPINVD